MVPAPTASGLEEAPLGRSLLPSLPLSGALGDGLLLPLNRGREGSRAHLAPWMWDNSWSFSPGQLGFDIATQPGRRARSPLSGAQTSLPWQQWHLANRESESLPPAPQCHPWTCLARKHSARAAFWDMGGPQEIRGRPGGKGSGAHPYVAWTAQTGSRSLPPGRSGTFSGPLPFSTACLRSEQGAPHHRR